MHQEIFKPNIFVAIILPVIVAVVLLVIYFAVGEVPPWVLLFLVIPVLMVVHGQKTKLIIEDDKLRYQQVFSGEEVSLKKVSKIVTREVETIVNTDQGSFNENRKKGFNISLNQGNQERRTEKVAYLLDEAGRTFFSFPADLIGLKNRRRFEEAVTAINPDIKVS